MSLDNNLSQFLDKMNGSNEFEQKIVEELLDSSKNLETKTEIQKPLSWSALGIIHEYLKQLGLTISANYLDKFTILTFKYLISKNRESRKEYLQALQSINGMNNLDNMQEMKKK